MKSYTLNEDEIYLVKFALKRCNPRHPMIKAKVQDLLDKLGGKK